MSLPSSQGLVSNTSPPLPRPCPQPHLDMIMAAHRLGGHRQKGMSPELGCRVWRAREGTFPARRGPPMEVPEVRRVRGKLAHSASSLGPNGYHLPWLCCSSLCPPQPFLPVSGESLGCSTDVRGGPVFLYPRNTALLEWAKQLSPRLCLQRSHDVVEPDP